MTGLDIVAVILIALLVTSIFFYGLNRTGPWGSFWTFMLVVFLGILLLDITTTPIGPIWWGIAWIDLLIIALLFSLLLAASGPDPRLRRNPEDTTDATAAVAVGVLFWIMVIFFLAVIAVSLLA